MNLAWHHHVECKEDFPWGFANGRARMSHVFFETIAPIRKTMITRAAKLFLLSGIALFYTLVVLNNTTDFDSNYQFVRHVLTMDTTFPGNKAMWRALDAPIWHLAFYWSVIVWEFVTTILCWWGAVVLMRKLRAPAAEFNAAKRIP